MSSAAEPLIRLLTDDDLPAAFEIVVQLRPHLDREELIARVGRQRAGGYQLLGAFVGGGLVGVLGMRPVETLARGRHLHVDDLVVRTEDRGKGYARLLLSVAEEAAAKDGRVAVFLDSRPEVLGFYEKLGYRPHTAVLVRKRM